MTCIICVKTATTTSSFNRETFVSWIWRSLSHTYDTTTLPY